MPPQERNWQKRRRRPEPAEVIAPPDPAALEGARPNQKDFDPDALEAPEALRITEGVGIAAEKLGRNRRIHEVAKAKLERYRRKMDEANRAAYDLRISEAIKIWNQSNGTTFSRDDYQQLLVNTPDARTEVEVRFLDNVQANAKSTTNVDDFLAFLEATVYDDAAEQVALEGKAYTSEKTGLINRTEAIRNRFEMLRRNFLMEQDPNDVIVVFEMDIVGLKGLNDRFGETKVDQFFMKEIGRRFREGVSLPAELTELDTAGDLRKRTMSKMRTDDIIAQLGGDEFQAIAQTKRTGVERLMGTIKDIFEAQPFDIDGELVPVKVRIGAEVHDRAAVKQMDMTDAQQLVSRLREKPLKMAKYIKFVSGSGSQVWSPEVVIPQGAEEEILLDTVQRGTGAVAAHIRERKGSQAYDDYRKALMELTRQYLK